MKKAKIIKAIAADLKHYARVHINYEVTLSQGEPHSYEWLENMQDVAKYRDILLGRAEGIWTVLYALDAQAIGLDGRILRGPDDYVHYVIAQCVKPVEANRAARA